MKVIVGSRNAAKVAAVQMGVGAYWPGASVEGRDVDSGVPAQPIGLEQTMQGALNRARAAQKLGGDLGIGLEGGVDTFAGNWTMFSFVAACDGTREYVVPVTGMPLPQAWGEAMQQGGELRPHVLALGLPYDHKTGVIGTLTQGKMSRDEMFAFAVKTVLAPWVNPEAYSPGQSAAA